MSLLRPAVRAHLLRWQEVWLAAGIGAIGLWLIWLGGLILIPAGLLLIAFAAGWGLIGWRRLAFARPIGAPGLVEWDEGQLSYFRPGSGAALGGVISLRDLAEIRLLSLTGQLHWRLKTLDGQALLIPLAAAGAEQLFDAFATLPGIDMARLSAALQQPRNGAGPVVQVLWQRPARAVLT